MQEHDLLARAYLTGYAARMWEGYQSPDHVVDLCTHLEMVERGEIKRLIVTLPPRHSKSLNFAQFFPAWYLGRNPDKQVIYSSYYLFLLQSGPGFQVWPPCEKPIIRSGL